MGSKNLKTNDLVWAKMKGYPYWPGKITSPATNTYPKKNCYYINFFGSNNHAWIKHDLIEIHNEKFLQKYKMSKGKLFRKAVNCIIEEDKHVRKHERTSKAVKVEIMSSNSNSQENTLDNNTPPKINKKLQIKKETSTPSQKENSANKQAHSPVKKKYIYDVTTFKQKFANKCAHSPKQNETKHHSILRDVPSSEEKFSLKGYTGGMHTSEKEFSWKNFCTDDKNKKKYDNLLETPPIDLAYARKTFSKKEKELTKKIGFLGLNYIGQGIVKKLYHSGHSLIIWNNTEEDYKMFTQNFKIKIAATPAEVMKSADLVFSCMPNPEAAKDIIDGNNGILEGLEQCKKSKSYIEMTSIDPKMSQLNEINIIGKGGHYLEAPFCVSRIDENEGTLMIVAAGEKMVYDECRSCFDAMSKKHMFISTEVGNASKLNIVHQMLIGTVYCSLAEALSFANKVELKAEKLPIILKGDEAQCNSNKIQILKSMMEGNYVGNISVNQMQQNFHLGLSLGHEVSQCLNIFSTANQQYIRAKMMKFGNHDASAVIESYLS